MDNHGTQGRKDWVDAGKGISMLLVVLFHSETYFPSTECFYSDFWGYMRMPFFFFLSGYVFTSDIKEFSLRHKLKQIFRGIVWTYLIFTSIIILPKSLLNHTPLSEGIYKIIIGQASWFVVTLGVSQFIYSMTFHFCRNLRIVPIVMVLSIVVGFCIKLFYDENMPYFFDSALLVNFFVGAGILYRHCEAIVNRHVGIKWRNFAILLSLYVALYYCDQANIKTPMYVYATNYHYENVLLYILYASIGIAALLQIVRLVTFHHIFLYIGRNSLVFYYLNGGCVRCLTFLLSLVGIHSSASMHFYPITIAMAMAATVVLTFVSMFIKRWMPLITGDKTAFNKLSEKMRLNIHW